MDVREMWQSCSSEELSPVRGEMVRLARQMADEGRMEESGGIMMRVADIDRELKSREPKPKDFRLSMSLLDFNTAVLRQITEVVAADTSPFVMNAVMDSLIGLAVAVGGPLMGTSVGTIVSISGRPCSIELPSGVATAKLTIEMIHHSNKDEVPATTCYEILRGDGFIVSRCSSPLKRVGAEIDESGDFPGTKGFYMEPKQGE